MNGPHDLGGRHGFGPVVVEDDEPVFHFDWERAVFGLQLACGGRGLYAGDEIRFRIEQMDPVHYLASSYYEHWLAGLEQTLIDKGIVDRATLERRIAEIEQSGSVARTPVEGTSSETAELLQLFRAGSWTDEESDAPPRFRSGDRVRTRTMSPRGHTRLPQYVRGKEGVVCAVYPSLVFPDSNAVGAGTNPQHVYNVEFSREELWGPDGDPGMMLRIDLWESYLEDPPATVERKGED